MGKIKISDTKDKRIKPCKMDKRNLLELEGG
jgi:hypothetical protein